MAIVGTRNVQDADSAAGSWEKTPGNAASEVASKPATNLDDPNPHRYWQSANATVANTKLMKDMGRVYSVRALDLQRWNGSQRSFVHTVLDDVWARRWMVYEDQISNSVALSAPTGDFSIGFWFRLPDHTDDSLRYDSTTVFVRHGLSASGAGAFWKFQTRPQDGKMWFRIQRNSVEAFEDLLSSARVDDGQWHHVLVTFNDTSNDAVMYLDFVEDNTGSFTRS